MSDGTHFSLDATGRWVPAAAAIAAAVIALVGFVAHASQALTGAYLSYVSGIWLALGKDLASGLFYRGLIGDVGYGGTRYFPLFFTVIAIFLKLGLPPLAAGWTASAVTAIVLATGLARVGRALGAPRSTMWLLGAGAIAPYFVQQTLFEVRADVLAAALNVWGVASIIPVWRAGATDRPRTGVAAAWFTLALAAKITSLATPCCVIVALLLSGRTRAAWRLCVQLAAGIAIFLLIVEVASSGRAIEDWRACMFAGSTQGGTVAALLTGDFLNLASFSHLLTILLVLDAAALAVAFVMARRARATTARGAAAASDWRSGRALWLPVMLFGGVTTATALALSSPGTIPSNQVAEWLQMSLIVLVWVAACDRRLTRVMSSVIAVLVVWMAVQDLVRTRDLWDTRGERSTWAMREAVTQFVAESSTRAPVLAESSLWEVLAGRQAYLLDPFALRVVMTTHPEVREDLEAKIDAHYFSSVIFQVDPTSAQGRGYYEHVNFGWPLTSRILEQYRFDRQLAWDVWIYVPKGQVVR